MVKTVACTQTFDNIVPFCRSVSGNFLLLFILLARTQLWAKLGQMWCEHVANYCRRFACPGSSRVPEQVSDADPVPSGAWAGLPGAASRYAPATQASCRSLSSFAGLSRHYFKASMVLTPAACLFLWNSYTEETQWLSFPSPPIECYT